MCVCVCVCVYVCVCYLFYTYTRYLACALILRGKVDVSDIRRNIDRCVFVFTVYRFRADLNLQAPIFTTLHTLEPGRLEDRSLLRTTSWAGNQ